MKIRRTLSSNAFKASLALILCLAFGSNTRLHGQEPTSSSSATGMGAASPPDSPSQSSDPQAEDSKNAVAMQPTQPMAAEGNYHPFNVRARSYLYDMFGPGAFIAAGIQAGVDSARSLSVPYPPDGFVGSGNHPAHGDVPEWGGGFQGYSKRYADRYGQEIIGTTIRYGLGEALREDVSYHRCDCTGFVPRLSHVFISPFVAYTESGRAVPSLPALVSPFLASEIAVKAWYPSRFDTSDALRTSSTVYFTLPLKNLFSEFGRR